jgi:hypothetical protein
VTNGAGEDAEAGEQRWRAMPTAEQDRAAPPTGRNRGDLDGLARLAAAGERHRYEMAADGTVSITPIGDPEAAVTISRLTVWLLTHGYGPEQVAVHCGLDLGGGWVRVPDVSVWAAKPSPQTPRSGYASPAGLRLVVEVTPLPDADGWLARGHPYAAAGIPAYWVVEQNDARTVHRHVLMDTAYRPEPTGPLPLHRLLAERPGID